MGRFIRPDSVDYLGASGSVLSYNLFAYCENDAVQQCDPLGSFGTPLQWICAIIGGIAGWFFGDYVARKIGLVPKGKGFWNAAGYWAVRALVVSGGAILGYVAAGALNKILVAFLKSNPVILAKIPYFAKWFLGMTGGKIVVGETMQRVISYAQQIGAETYNGFKYYEKIKNLFGSTIADLIGKADNALWLINKLSQQYQIFDIGIDPNRAARSSSYLLEQIILWLTKYKNIVNAFFGG